MIYTIGGIKGGSGKTTVACNLTVMLASAGRDVLLVDADEQATATDFTTWRNERTDNQAGYTAIQLHGPSVRTQVLKLEPKYEDVIIDTGGRDTDSQRAALSVSSAYLVPFVPQSFDIWTLEKVVRLIKEIQVINPNMQSYSFLNRAFAKGNDNDEACEILKEAECLRYINAPLISRKAFSNASAQGMAVHELRPADSKAIAEMTALFDFCVKLKINSK